MSKRFVFAPDPERAKAWYGHTAYSEATLAKIKRLQQKDHHKDWKYYEVESQAREVK